MAEDHTGISSATNLIKDQTKSRAWSPKLENCNLEKPPSPTILNFCHDVLAVLGLESDIISMNPGIHLNATGSLKLVVWF